MELCLQFSESDIENWAARYVDCQPLSARQWEQTLIDQKQSIGRAKCMTINELYDLAFWKSRRQSKRIWNNKSVVESITRDAFSSPDNWEKIQILRQLDGISVARASAILHLYDDGLFPIVDRFAVLSVDKKGVVSNSYTEPFWRAYVPFCRELAKRYHNDMRLVDRALMYYGYIHFG